MPVSKPAAPLQLTETERLAMQRAAARDDGRSISARRARIILLLDEGRTNTEICNLLACSAQTVNVWRRRFQTLRAAGLDRRSPRSHRRIP